METRQEFNDRIYSSYQKEKLRIEEIIDRLADSNKIFLNNVVEREEFGKPFLFAIFDFLEPNVENLQTVDNWLDGEISYFFSKFKSNGSDIVKLVDLFTQLQHFQLESKDEIDADKLIKKLKRDVYELKKKYDNSLVFISHNADVISPYTDYIDYLKFDKSIKKDSLGFVIRCTEKYQKDWLIEKLNEKHKIVIEKSIWFDEEEKYFLHLKIANKKCYVIPMKK